MKNTIRFAGAAVAALAIAMVPAMSAHAASSGITQTATLTQAWDYQYGSAVSPNGNIQVIPDYSNGDAVYFAYADSNTIVAVTDTNGDISYPYGAAFSPDGTIVYVVQYGAETLIVDVATATVTGTIAGSDPADENQVIGVSPDGKYLVQGDDYDDVYVYDISNGYAQVGSYDDTYANPINVFFPNSTTAYIANDDGTIQILDLATGVITDTWDNGTTGAYGACANADVTSIAIVPQGGSDFELQFIDPATGDVQGTVDMATVTDFSQGAYCAITNKGTLLMTEWGAAGPFVHVIDANTYTFVETLTIDLDGLEYTDSINVMAGCKTFVAGYYGNLAVLQLPSTVCTPSTPELPNTGVDTTSLAVAVGIALIVFAAGTVLVLRRRVS